MDIPTCYVPFIFGISNSFWYIRSTCIPTQTHVSIYEALLPDILGKKRKKRKKTDYDTKINAKINATHQTLKHDCTNKGRYLADFSTGIDRGKTKHLNVHIHKTHHAPRPHPSFYDHRHSLPNASDRLTADRLRVPYPSSPPWSHSHPALLDPRPFASTPW